MSQQPQDDFCAYTGEDWASVFVQLSADGSVEPVAGDEYTWTISLKGSDAVAAQVTKTGGGITLDTVTGRVVATFARSVTENLAAGIYEHQMLFQAVAGEAEMLFTGEIKAIKGLA